MISEHLLRYIWTIFAHIKSSFVCQSLLSATFHTSRVSSGTNNLKYTRIKMVIIVIVILIEETVKIVLINLYTFSKHA